MGHCVEHYKTESHKPVEHHLINRVLLFLTQNKLIDRWYFQILKLMFSHIKEADAMMATLMIDALPQA